MANCCTNEASKVSTWWGWEESKTADWRTITTTKGQFGGKMFFYEAYAYVVTKSKDKKFDQEVLKAMVCAMKDMVAALLDSAWAFNADKNENYEANQKQIAKWNKEVKLLCKDETKNVTKTKSCKKELGSTAYNTLKDSCDTDEKVQRIKGKCKCALYVKKVKVIKGCTDSDYKEYNKKATKDDGSCKTLKVVAGCMDDGEGLPQGVKLHSLYNPDANYNTGCEYSTTIQVKNNYMFCTDDTDGTFDGCDPEEARGISDGFILPKTYKVIADTPNRVNNIRERILDIVTTSISSHNDIPYIPIRNENRFTKASNVSLIDDITNALTVSVVETQFKRSEDDPEFQVYPFTYVTGYSPQGGTHPITEFKIKRNTAIDAPVGITGIVPVDSTNTFKKRLANIPGLPTVNPNLVNVINKVLVQLKIKDIQFNDEGVLQENRIPNVGLGKVLYKEPIGLEKLIK